jgi:hypothetical protein
MQGYLIDPFTKTVSVVELAGKENLNQHMQDMYRLLHCDVIGVVWFMDIDEVVLIDDEGLLKDLDEQQFFELCGGLYAGYGLMVGTDSDGNSVNPSFTVEALRERVSWPDHDKAVERAEQNMGFSFISF